MIVAVRRAEVGRYRGGPDALETTLSDRQRETLADVATNYELGCAPRTASDDLQAAEAKLADAAVNEFDSED